MNDLISRKMAIIQLSHNKTGDDDCDVVIQRDIETIKSLPSAQPEIVRCKDCANASHDPLYDDLWCDGKQVYGEHYCSYAERKTDD